MHGGIHLLRALHDPLCDSIAERLSYLPLRLDLTEGWQQNRIVSK
jgi:hypothetical protein